MITSKHEITTYKNQPQVGVEIVNIFTSGATSCNSTGTVLPGVGIIRRNDAAGSGAGILSSGWLPPTLIVAAFLTVRGPVCRVCYPVC